MKLTILFVVVVAAILVLVVEKREAQAQGLIPAISRRKKGRLSAALSYGGVVFNEHRRHRTTVQG